MGTTGLNEGHEKLVTGATWQSDGLRDSDVLSTATLTNFTERGLLNGVIPLNLNNAIHRTLVVLITITLSLVIVV